MGVRSYFKNTAKANTNVTAWTDWNTVSSNAKFIKTLVSDIKPKDKVTAEPIQKATFEEVVARFRLTDQDLKKRMSGHFWLSMGCALLALLAFAWFGYLLLHGLFTSSCVALAVSFLMGTYAVTENLFWYRIKKRKLDCTFREWLLHFFGK